MAVKKLASTVFCTGVFLAVAWTQPLANSVISGAVVDGESGDGIRKAVVTLTLQGTPRRWATTRTDGSGQFRFEGLPAGKYELRATKAFEGTAIFGADHVRELGDLITLADGEMRAVTLRFLRAASVSGHVYDSDGEPVPDSSVSLLRQGRNFGAPILVSYLGATTDERGEYRISNVDPGQYYLFTTPGGRNGFGGPGSRTILAHQYYAGARDPKDATPVHVGAGENLTGLDFRVASELAITVRGQIAGIPAEIDAAQTEPPRARRFGRMSVEVEYPVIEVTISPAEAGQQRWSQGIIAQGPEHRFQLGDLPAGRYRVDAVFHSAGKTFAASQVFDLHAGSGDIVLTLAPTADIQGTLKMEGQAPRAAGAPATTRGESFHVQFARPGTLQSNVSAQVAADGHFSIEQVPPGEWQLSVNPLPPGFLKSAQFGDKDIRFTTFEVGSSSDVPLHIVVSMNTASVEGEIDAGPSDSKRAGIVIAPVGPFHNLARFYYGTAADDDGKFKMSGIAPGKYKIFALEKMAAAPFRNPEAADQLDELGEVVDLAEGAKVQVHPKLIPADRAAKAVP
jgi:carboxypeptidase family protein